MTDSSFSSSVELFNSPLETGVRALVVLNAAYPMMFDLTHLTWFDHLVVHTGDVGGPKSLHPDLPHRSGELLVRRSIIEKSLKLIRRMHLIDVIVCENGILYQASEGAFPFVNLMRTTYACELKNRAEWLSENICKMTSKDLEKLVIEKVGRWKVEFNSESNRSGQ